MKLKEALQILDEFSTVENDNEIGGVWSKVQGWECGSTGQSIYEARMNKSQLERFIKAAKVIQKAHEVK